MTHVTEATASPVTYRYWVELASHESTIDDEFNEVPRWFETFDVVVSQPTLFAIEKLLTERGYLKGWSIVSFWVPDFNEPF